MGPRRTPLRHADHLVPDRRRSVHRLHLHRRSRARLRRRRDCVFRRTLHDPDLSDPVPGVSAPLVCLPQAQLHHRRRFRPRPLRQSLARARRHRYRHRRDHALYRAATGRPSGRHRRYGCGYVRLVGLGCRSAADHRLHHPRRLHLFERPACAGVDRHRQGYLDLHHRLRRRYCRSDPIGRLRKDLRRDSSGKDARWRPPAPTRPAPTASM